MGSLMVASGPLTALAEGAPGAAVFHVSPAGSDTADGRSPATAWSSLDRANRHVFRPGETLALEGGARHVGSLWLDANDAGSAADPVVITSYGAGRASIAAAGAPGIYVHNTAGVRVRDLVLQGDAAAYRAKGGISFYSDRAEGRLAGVTVAGVDVSGFRHGIEIGGATAGFSEVGIRDAVLHDNRDAGLITYGPAFDAVAPGYAHARVAVTRVRAHSNAGDPDNLVRNTGSGIVLGSVDTGSVSESTAYGNGTACRAPEGPAGIWTYDSTGIVVARNLSYRNRTGGPADGDGFDLDQNVSHSVLQYNLAYDNDGAGYLVYTGQDNAAHHSNVVRFNLSSNDARASGWYAGITVVGRLSGLQVHNNTVVMRDRSPGRSAVTLGSGLSGVALRNNVLLASRGMPAVVAPSLPPAAVRMQGNAYGSAGPAARWGGVSYPTLADLRAGTGQELLDGRSVGVRGDLGLVSPYEMPGVTDPRDVDEARGMAPGPGSPLAAAGLDLPGRFGIDPGGRDYFGTALGARLGIGAARLRIVPG